MEHSKLQYNFLLTVRQFVVLGRALFLVGFSLSSTIAFKPFNFQ